MSIENFKDIGIEEATDVAEVAEAEADTKPIKADEKPADFKFFKCCSATLKRFSVIMFVINLFFAIAITSVAVVLIAVYLGVNLITLLALPLLTLFIVLVVIARFFSALIYGFAEIVEKNENK